MIGVNGVFLRPGRVGGVESMMYNLVGGLAAVCDSGIVVSLPESARLAADYTSRWGAGDPTGRIRLVRTREMANRFLTETAILPGQMKALGVERAIFPNYFTPPRRLPFRVVTVIQDLLYRHIPEVFSPTKRIWLRFAHGLTLQQAERVVLTSEFVRQDVLETYGERYAHKLAVIPIPISWERLERPGPLDPRPSPYILSVAAHYPHKNLRTLIRAFARLVARLPTHRLVLVGQLRRHLIGLREGGESELSSLIEELGLSDRVEVAGHVDEATLGHLYREADVFVYPSLFEGFGMPPVEALGLGLPTLTTRCTSLPEVTLGKAMYVQDPTDEEEMAEMICWMATHRDEAKPSATDVVMVRDRYSPTRIAQQYLDLFN